jgi:hypothetical protein
MFQPSPASYGDPSPGGPDALALIEQYAPVVQGAAESLTDSARQVETLKAQIANTKRMIRLTPVGDELLRMRLRKLQARLRAAKRRQQKQREGESSTRTYRALGQVGAIVGIGIGLAVIVRILRK